MEGNPWWRAPRYQAGAEVGIAGPLPPDAPHGMQRLWSLGSGAALVLILALSAFLQFYRLDDLQHFQGDEGILALAARALVMDHIFPVYGLALAVGSAHIGPLFDYLIALPLWLSGFNPTAAVALNGLCQVLSVGLCYTLLVRVGGGRLAGLVAALVYATAQEVVYYARFLWPNMFPCMLLLILWSLLALRAGRQHHIALLGIWLGIALQLQPTGVLLLPFLALYIVLFRPPLRSLWYALIGLLAFVLLFAPAILHDVTHGLVETKAWLNYSHHSAPHDRALGPTLARVGVLAQRLVGVQQAPLAAALGLALGLGAIARALLPKRSGFSELDELATLARLILLLGAVCLGGYLFFGSQLRPHYFMPLFPVPALVLGMVVAPWPSLAGASGLGARFSIALRGAGVVLALALSVSNSQHTWQAGFLLDRYQITLQPEQSNRITLGEMRQLSAFILQRAAGRDFNLLFAAQDDQPFAYQALLLAGGGRLGYHADALRFLIVQPADWRPAHWPGWVRQMTTCARMPPKRFAAGLVWIMEGAPACLAAQPVTDDSPPVGQR